MINIIQECYSECPRTQQLHQDFAGYSLEECAQDVVNKLSELEHYKFVEYKEEELVGYYATTKIQDNNVLYTFFVRPKFRNKEVLTRFWDNIKKEFGGEFTSMVYGSNEPAKNFLRRNCEFEYIIEGVSFFKF